MIDIQLLRNDTRRGRRRAWRCAAAHARPRRLPRAGRGAQDDPDRARRSCRAQRNAHVQADRPGQGARARTPPRCMAEVGGARRRAAGGWRRSWRDAQRRLRDFLAGDSQPAARERAGGQVARRTTSKCAAGARRARSISPSKTMSIWARGSAMLDFDARRKITGARFVLMTGALARLHRALAQFMLDVHTGEHGYTEVYAPYLVNADSMRGTGQLPKFEEDLFVVPRGDEKLLPDSHRRSAGDQHRARRDRAARSAAAEVRLPHAVLPLRGRLLRQGHARHDPPAPVRQGGAGADRAAGEVLRRARGTDRPRRERSCSGSSCPTASWRCAPATWGFPRPRPTTSKCGCRRRRPTAKSPPAPTSRPFRRGACRRAFATSKGKPELVHTLNGSGLAVGRTLVAILENYQNADGCVTIPEALRPYMGGQARIEKERA